MKIPFFWLPLILLLFLVVGWSEAGKAKVHITDDLDDVVDGEEDEAWKEWGKKKPSVPEKFDPPKIDYDTMSLSEIQHEIMSRQYGPVFGFVKLRLGTRRTRVIKFSFIFAFGFMIFILKKCKLDPALSFFLPF